MKKIIITVAIFLQLIFMLPAEASTVESAIELEAQSATVELNKPLIVTLWANSEEVDLSEVEVSINNKNASIEQVDVDAEGEESSSSKRMFQLVGLKKGQTTVVAKYGKQKTTIKVKVVGILATEIQLEKYTLTLEQGDTYEIKYKVLPLDTENKKLTWSTSDSKIARVSAQGKVTAVAVGTATIIAKTSNGIEKKVQVTVKKQQGKLKVTASASHGSYNQVGKSWSKRMTVNNIDITKKGATISVKVGDVVTIYAEAQENDNNPDFDCRKKTYTITAEDLNKGFTLSLELKVTEDGGRYRGRSCMWTMTFNFIPTK